MSLINERLTDAECDAEVRRLFRHIEHGDDKHRDWLWTELRTFFGLEPEPRPPPSN